MKISKQAVQVPALAALTNKGGWIIAIVVIAAPKKIPGRSCCRLNQTPALSKANVTTIQANIEL